ncbi:uncharacterized protein L3040_005226 [Drepanopeziza brunnea f. sp. 'multigermtubi']|uniref:Ethyl tert-butyl ether degradation EthD n=1 Tax=Marssonina brunnea f. sp. multigermtubi (strain MB_m1) TaxID=1072389 RepID=K1WIM3_MARBU|nr:ethyl tert-butyl ether degradation EthD [Drepanopeziza brunnea f. sp. 'multigermtubi' MB_m1]EKD12641.1 ethyl tert-butyl ether degradation EthD [Drepanopeziza brunnea f. sp. 'multigermtubi' MB_m1]KAJ5041648.1 hypothetical protein L3040_005226 [Drepanopeziza brunnea f. sp. 'multigermtubi']
MTAILTLVYPKGTKEFDMNYYLTSHMPMVQATWAGCGLQKWEVVQLDPASGNVTKCILYFESAAKMQAAFGGPDAAKVLGDIPNYCDVQPLQYAGEIVGGS